MNITVKTLLEGEPQLKRIFEKLPQRVQRKIMLKAMRDASKPMKNMMRTDAPNSGRTFTTKKNGEEVIHEPGTLIKSIGITNSKSKMPSIYVGPRYGKKYKYDGYYFSFVTRGTKYIHHTDPFIQDAFDATQEIVGVKIKETIWEDMAKVIERESAKLKA